MNTDILSEMLGALADEQLEKCECFGGQAAVISDGDTVYNRAFGDGRFNDNSLYRLASVTKLFTACGFLKLCGEFGLSVFSPVSEFLPEYAHLAIGKILPDGRICNSAMPKRQITLFDLLTHSAGLGSAELGNREYATVPPEIKTDLAKVTDYYASNFHLAFEPGEQAAYSGFAGYDVLARIIETVSGKRFGVYLRENIFEPLGMRDTTFQPNEEQYSRLVPMHQRISGVDKEVNFHGNVFRGVPPTYEMAGASIVSSMRDLIAFCKILDSENPLIPRETIADMMSPKLPDELPGLPKGENNGYGCFMITGQHRLPKSAVYSHGAYGTHILFLPDKKTVGIFLKNSYFDMSVSSHSTVMFETALIKSVK